jgi:hypothetical protein
MNKNMQQRMFHPFGAFKLACLGVFGSGGSQRKHRPESSGRTAYEPPLGSAKIDRDNARV